jgi:hypothetical protein
MDLNTRYYALRSDSDQLANIANWRSILTLTVFFLSSKSGQIDAPSSFGLPLEHR